MVYKTVKSIEWSEFVKYIHVFLYFQKSQMYIFIFTKAINVNVYPVPLLKSNFNWGTKHIIISFSTSPWLGLELSLTSQPQLLQCLDLKAGHPGASLNYLWRWPCSYHVASEKSPRVTTPLHDSPSFLSPSCLVLPTMSSTCKSKR